jgi:hypothetical protein
MIYQPIKTKMYMDNLTSKEPGIRNTTVQDSPNKEPRKKESRPVISAKAQTILEFLRACSPYEADSIRVMVSYATGKGDIETIEATDMLAINRFLNHGLGKENEANSEAVMKHRQTRAQKLMEAVKEFVNIGQLCRISVALMKVSSDFKAVEDARQHLQSQPVTNGSKN